VEAAAILLVILLKLGDPLAKVEFLTSGRETFRLDALVKVKLFLDASYSFIF